MSRAILVLLALFFAVYAENKEGDVCTDEYTNTVGRCATPDNCPRARENYENNGIFATFCQSSFDITLVCCQEGGILQTPPPYLADKVGPIWDSSDDTVKERVSIRKCKQYSSYVTKPVHFLALMPQSPGLSLGAADCALGRVGLVIGGQKAEVGEFPHMAAVGWANYDEYKFSCGGSLISPRFVVTAGHCSEDPRMADPRPVVVRLGARDLDPGAEDGGSPVDIAIRHIHAHPDYAPPVKYNDIALLELATDVEFTEGLRPACIWTQLELQHDRAVATGWGVTDTRTNKLSKDLQKVSLDIQNSNDCNELLRAVFSRKWRGFSESQLCAGVLEGGKDTCQGDSGGPLQVTSRENSCMYYIIGITSFGRKCGQKHKPGVYTRVSSYVDWIESVVWPGE